MAFGPQTPSTAAILALPIIGAMTGTAHAYLDTGTGSMILQIVLGGIADVHLLPRYP